MTGVCKLYRSRNRLTLLNLKLRSPIDDAWRRIFTGAGEPQYLSSLMLLFPSVKWCDWDFSDLHKIVLGILPLDLATMLKNPHIQAQVNLPDFRGRTPLYWASLKGDTNAVKNLLIAGANANSLAYGNDAPLHAAAFSQNPRVFKLLIMAGADVDFANLWGDTPLNCACNHRDVVACIEPLINRGAQLDHKNYEGTTPLSDAALKNNIKIGSFLLNLNANMHIRNNRGETPLFRTIMGGNHDFLKLLLQNGDDCTNVTAHSATVLHYTAQYGDIKTASILKSAGLRGIKPDALDFKGRTATQILEQCFTAEEGFKEVFESLLEVSGWLTLLTLKILKILKSILMLWSDKTTAQS